VVTFLHLQYSNSFGFYHIFCILKAINILSYGLVSDDQSNELFVQTRCRIILNWVQFPIRVERKKESKMIKNDDKSLNLPPFDIFLINHRSLRLDMMCIIFFLSTEKIFTSETSFKLTLIKEKNKLSQELSTLQRFYPFGTFL